MRIAITGATGNLGTALLRHLQATAPEHDLVGVARRVPEEVAPYAGVQWHTVDVSAADAAQRLTVPFAAADAVVHLAWAFQPSHDEAQLEATGVGGTRAVLATAREVGVRHLVHMSSVGAYAPARDDTPVTEDWPTTGVPTSPYSRHKATAERLLDDHDDEPGRPAPALARLRPGFVVQRDAASALLRYGLPGYVPAALLKLLPVLPLDRELLIPLVHAADVARAIVQTLEQQSTGAFNLAAEPAITRDDLARALGARAVHVPAGLLRALVDLTWRMRVQALDPSWLDLALAAPIMDTRRARTELGWSPGDATAALAEVVAGMQDGAHGDSPTLRARTPLTALRDLLRTGPISTRRRS